MKQYLACRGVAALALAAALATTSVGAAPVTVSDAARRGLAPEVAVGRDGSIHVLWLDKGVAPADGPPPSGRPSGPPSGGHSHQSSTDLFYARSDDGGRTFHPAVRVNTVPGEVWGFAVSKPRIAIGATGIVHVFYPANAISSATGKPVAVSTYTRSTDGGKTFAPGRVLNGTAQGDLSDLVHGGLSQAHVFGTMAVDEKGNVYALWLDTREMPREKPLSTVYMAVSRDEGASFEPERKVFPGDNCPCCQLTAATDASGALYVGGRKVSMDNVRDPVVGVSRDGGRTFGERAHTGGVHWTLDGCPLKPTVVAVDGPRVYAAVHNGAEAPPAVLFSSSTDGGSTFGNAVKLHPEAAVSDAPALAVSSSGLFAFWHAKVGAGERRVYMRMSPDHGQTLGPVQEVASLPGNAGYPAAAPLPDGRAVVVWQQGERVMLEVVSMPVDCKCDKH